MKILLGIIRVIFSPIKIIHSLIFGGGRPNIVGYAWYTKDEYKKIIESSEDDLDILIASFEKWKEIADKYIEDMKGEGFIVIKVNIESQKLGSWLREQNFRNTSESRQRYVRQRLRDFLDDAII